MVFILMAQLSWAQERPRFGATFVQLWAEHDHWPAEHWDWLCQDLAQVGVQEIIIQWSLYTEPAFYWRLKTQERTLVPQDPVAPQPAVLSLVQAAQKHGLQVRFGLTEDPAWWAKIKNEPLVLQVFLERIFWDQVVLARTLWDNYGHDPVFAGFYIPQEIDDKTWVDAKKRQCLLAHVQKLSTALRTMDPSLSLGISCFASGFDHPQGLAQLMYQLAAAGVDQILYQDGLGTEQLSFGESKAYGQALVHQALQENFQVRVVVETFSSQGSSGFVPASMERIRLQMKQGAGLSNAPLIAFSIPDYMHPLAGSAAQSLGQDYAQYLLD